MSQKLLNLTGKCVGWGYSPDQGKLISTERLTGMIVLVIALLALLAASPLRAAPSAQSPFDLSSLTGQAQAKGRVRVIVSLKVAFQPEDNFARPQDAQNQRQTIQRAQGSLLQKMAGSNLTLVAQFKYIPALTVEVDAAALAKLAALPEVAALTADQAVPPALASSIPVIGADDAWAAGFTGLDQTVVILDTGVDKNHPFFTTNGQKVVAEACYSSNVPTEGASSVCPGGATESTAPDSGANCSLTIGGCDHGTHVAGIAAGNDNGVNIGVARDATLIAIQVFSRFDDGLTPGAPTPCADAGTATPCALSYPTDQIKALERVFELRQSFNIAAVNMSLGGGQFFAPCDNQPIKAAIDNLRTAGVATVIAAGNNGFTNSISTPGCVSSAVSVGATDDTDNVAVFSNIASFVSLLAPGVNIDSSIPGGVASFNGTSMAAPHVAGAGAVLKQQRPDASVTEILSILRQTGIPVNDNRPFGAVTNLRRIHLGQAINAVPPQTNIYLPIIFGPGASPDLVVDCICGDALNPHIMPHGSGHCPAPTSAIEVTIRNRGAAPVTASFWVDIYLNPVPVPTGVNQIWDDGRAPYGLAWGVSEAALPLEPGQTLTLTTRPDDPYLVRSRSLLPSTSLTNAAIYAQVDSVNLDTTYGGVLETHEVNGGAYNNILGGVTTVTLTATTLDPAPKQAEPSGNLPSRL